MGWLGGGLVGWWAGWVVGWLGGGLVGWWAGWVVGWLGGGLVECWYYWFVIYTFCLFVTHSISFMWTHCVSLRSILKL